MARISRRAALIGSASITAGAAVVLAQVPSQPVPPDKECDSFAARGCSPRRHG